MSAAAASSKHRDNGEPILPLSTTALRTAGALNPSDPMFCPKASEKTHHHRRSRVALTTMGTPTGTSSHKTVTVVVPTASSIGASRTPAPRNNNNVAKSIGIEKPNDEDSYSESGSDDYSSQDEGPVIGSAASDEGNAGEEDDQQVGCGRSGGKKRSTARSARADKELEALLKENRFDSTIDVLGTFSMAQLAAGEAPKIRFSVPRPADQKGSAGFILRTKILEATCNSRTLLGFSLTDVPDRRQSSAGAHYLEPLPSVHAPNKRYGKDGVELYAFDGELNLDHIRRFGKLASVSDIEAEVTHGKHGVTTVPVNSILGQSLAKNKEQGKLVNLELNTNPTDHTDQYYTIGTHRCKQFLDKIRQQVFEARRKTVNMEEMVLTLVRLDGKDWKDEVAEAAADEALAAYAAKTPFTVCVSLKISYLNVLA